MDKEETIGEIVALIDSYDGLLLDLDGVVYRGGAAIDGAVDAINEISKKMTVGYVTNNSSRTQTAVADQLRGFGLDLEDGQVISSAAAAVDLLKQQLPNGSVMVVGGEGLRNAVAAAGYSLVETSDDKPDAVLQGFSPTLGWKDLAEAAFAVQNGAIWIATNQDWTLPLEKGLAPGNGTLVSAVHTAVGSLPEFAGKPARAIFDRALLELGMSKPLFVGDRIDTDIVGAKAVGIDSALVFTGVATYKETVSAKPEGRADYLISNLGELLVDYPAPVATKRGYKAGKALVELLANKVSVIDYGSPIEILRAGCSVVWNSEVPIYGLEVSPEIYKES